MAAVAVMRQFDPISPTEWSMSSQGLTPESTPTPSPSSLSDRVVPEDARKLPAGDLYQKCLHPEEQEWFTLRDCLWRYTLTLMLFYWTLVLYPVSFAYYTVRHNMLWYGKVWGLLLSLTYPVHPLGIVALVVVKKVRSWFEADWSMAGPGRVFFVKPENPIASFLWDLYLTQSMYVGQFYLVGTSAVAIDHTWKDTLLTKDYWRKALTAVNGRLPRQLGRWMGKSLKMDYPLGTSDVVVKIPDSYLGIGDSFWNYGEEYVGEQTLTDKLAENYDGKEAMVLEFVRPKKSLGVHSLDIVTVRTPDGDVKVLSVLLWTDCTTGSSHSCRAGYTVDVETETIVGAAKWYSPFFAKMKSPLVGTQLHGVREACQTAVAAHKGIREKWLTAIGWDAMIMEDQVVFFEGNFAGARTPRRMFLSLGCMVEFVRSFAWPFGRGGSMTPGFQAF